MALEQDIGPEPQTLHHTRTKPFDKDIAMLNECQQCVTLGGIFQIKHQRAPTANRRAALLKRTRAPTLHAHNISAHVGKQHAGKRCWANRADLHYPQSFERTAAFRSALTNAYAAHDLPRPTSERPMISFITSLLPPRMRSIRAATHKREIGNSRI